MKWLKNIEAENKRLTRLIDDLLTLSRADTNQKMIETETFMICEVIFEALTLFEPFANEKNIALDVDNIDEKSAFYGDRKRIKQLVIILVDNALHYTDSGKVSVSLTKSEKETVLIVSDTGHGIEAEHIDKIFDRFYRVSKTRKLNQNGSGLGLSIAKWIVLSHGGTIHVISTPGIGTEFVVRFSA